MKHQILLSGHGGQGVLDLGNFLAYHALLEGRHVVFTPSYGPESRGGKVRCYVITSDGEVDSPIAEEPDVELILNLPSMDFEPLLRPGGLFIYNTSLVKNRKPERDDTVIVPVPATELAGQLADDLDAEYVKTLRDVKMAQNCVMWGAYLSYMGAEPNLEAVFGHFYTGKKAHFNRLNIAAVRKGMAYITEQGLAGKGA